MRTRPSDALVARLARIGDEELAGETGSPGAQALLEQIVSVPMAARERERRRPIVVAFAAALVLGLAVSVPALGIGQEVVSFFAGWRDPGSPVPTASDVVIASGEAGVPWKIVATTSDQGLCLGFLSLHPTEGWMGGAGCGPTDVRGDPWAANARHSIEAFGDGSGGSEGLNRHFVSGRLADDVSAIDFLLTDGTTVAAHIVKGPETLGAPLDYYWASWPCALGCMDDSGPFLEMAVARGGDGQVLERRVPIWNGNPTGDPDGPPPPLG